jgi:hypothetical protein
MKIYGSNVNIWSWNTNIEDIYRLIFSFMSRKWLFLKSPGIFISWKDEGKLRKLSSKADETDKTLLENLLNQKLNMINTSKGGIYVR